MMDTDRITPTVTHAEVERRVDEALGYGPVQRLVHGLWDRLIGRTRRELRAARIEKDFLMELSVQQQIEIRHLKREVQTLFQSNLGYQNAR
jgi:hypothetical protein